MYIHIYKYLNIYTHHLARVGAQARPSVRRTTSPSAGSKSRAPSLLPYDESTPAGERGGGVTLVNLRLYLTPSPRVNPEPRGLGGLTRVNS